jgi:(2S)-methylsuccinyl-CoA dehydrogenase
MDAPLTQQVDHARVLLARLRPLFEGGVAALAQACAPDDKLDSVRLDEQQVATFEIAWASADLLAAETALARLGAGSDALQSRLALIFAVDAIAALLPRLEALYIELGLPLWPLQNLGADAAWATLRGAACGAQALTAAGRALVAAGDAAELGSVALDESVVMAQDAFRRFATDVVAPQAEAIHRHDETVPESLLQPMRDMGVFGLSIPRVARRHRAERRRGRDHDGGRDRGLVRSLAGGGWQPDHAARDPEPCAHERWHR